MILQGAPLCNSLVARVIGLAILVGLSTSGLALAAPAMQVVQRWKLGGAGGWDYLTFDSATHRLFISRATRVEVVDTLSGQVVGTIADTLGVHGIALAPDLHRGFTSNGKADSITVFDLDTLKTIQEVKIQAHNPDAILYEPSGKHVFTFNGKSKDITVLDARPSRWWLRFRFRTSRNLRSTIMPARSSSTSNRARTDGGHR